MPDAAQRKAARVFGVTYLVATALVMFAFVRFYAPWLVWGKHTETARHLATHQRDIHIYMACAVTFGIGMVILAGALYSILRPIGRGLAVFGVLCRLTYVLAWFVFVLDGMTAARIMSGASNGQALGADQLSALAGLQLASGWDAYYVALIFYGLGTLAFSVLWLQSRYIPQVLASLGILASLFAGFCAFAYLVAPGFGDIVSANYYEMPSLLFEVVLSGWLLVRGTREPKVKVAVTGG